METGAGNLIGQVVRNAAYPFDVHAFRRWRVGEFAPLLTAGMRDAAPSALPRPHPAAKGSR